MIVRLLETAEEMGPIEDLQGKIWTGDDSDVVPLHVFVSAAHNGGLVLGAFEEDKMVGFAYGFPGLDAVDGENQLKHYSHMLGVLPEYRDRGVGYLLKRAQWQLVRHQNIPLITWTFDPLQGKNAFFNIAKLGAISNTYLDQYYGELHDELNVGMPSDRLEVELWVNSSRVTKRLGKRPRQRLSLNQFLEAGVQIVNPTRNGQLGLPEPGESDLRISVLTENGGWQNLLLVEIPKDIQSIKQQSMELSVNWRMHTRGIFATLFNEGYLVTDFIYPPEDSSSGYYVLSHGDASLGRQNS